MNMSTLTEEVPRVRLTLAGSLLSDVPNPTSVVVNNDTLFRYDGLYLLTYNDKRYFLFQSINSECKPEQVYVLQEEHIRNIEYIDIPPLKPDCVPATLTPVPPTPTPTAVNTQPPATPTP